MAVKMIKIGQRDCILTEDHCIPFDMVSRVEWFPEGNDKRSRIFTATVSEGIPIAVDEAKQLKKLLSIG